MSPRSCFKDELVGSVVNRQSPVSRFQHLSQLQSSSAMGIPHPPSEQGWSQTMMRAVLRRAPRWPDWSFVRVAWKFGFFLCPILHLPLSFTAIDPWHVSLHPHSTQRLLPGNPTYNKAFLCHLLKHSLIWAHFIILSCERVTLFLNRKTAVNFSKVNSASNSHPFTFSRCVTEELSFPLLVLAKYKR